MPRLAPFLVLLAALAAAAPATARPLEGWIVNGTTAPAGAYPWQVALIGGADATQTPASQFCGGTLIAANRVATAAHCVVDEQQDTVAPASLDVFAGQTDLRGSGSRHDVAAISVHPAANVDFEEPPRNDAAVLTLATPVPAAQPVTVIGTSETALWAAGRALTVTGWGVTGYTTPGDPDTAVLANELQETDVPRLADATCSGIWGAFFDAADMLCAGGGDADSCNGDSGGGLLARTTSAKYRWTPAAWRLTGIVSWGATPCDEGAPGVYTRVAAAAINGFLTNGSPPAAPAAGGAPPFTGAPVAGQTATCASPGWGGATVTERFDIYRIPSGGPPVRVAADTASHAITEADVGARLVCLVSARTAGGQAAAESAALGPVTTAAGGGARTTTDPGATTGGTRPGGDLPPRAGPATPPATLPSVTAPDRAPPRAAVVGSRRCRARRCTLTVLVSDPSPSSGIASVTARVAYRRRTTCRRGGRRVRCTRTVRRTITARRLSATTFRLRTPRLPRGRRTLRVTATDRAGNRQRIPSTVRLRVR